MPTPPDLALLEAFRWTRLRGAVRNLRQDRAREHPLWILHGLLMFAVPSAAKDGRSRFVFRPLAPTGDAIQRHQVYPFEVFFPGDELGLAHDCAAGLARHLADPRNNFALEHLDPPQVRSLADLADAAPS